MSSPKRKDENPAPISRLSFLEHLSPDYLEALEAEYYDNPQALSPDWQFFFDAYSLGKDAPEVVEVVREQPSAGVDPAIVDELKVLNLISAYRGRGHLIANVDPLKLQKPPFD